LFKSFNDYFSGFCLLVHITHLALITRVIEFENKMVKAQRILVFRKKETFILKTVQKVNNMIFFSEIYTSELLSKMLYVQL